MVVVAIAPLAEGNDTLLDGEQLQAPCGLYSEFGGYHNIDSHL